MHRMDLTTARQFAQQASRGGLTALGEILRSLTGGDVYDINAPGSGISAAAGAIHKSSRIRSGEIITTRILLDLTDLESEATDLDIIGDDGAANCHLGQIIAGINGTILTGLMTCLETPAGGEPDIDLYAADESTGVEGALITGLTETQILDRAGDWVANDVRTLSAFPADTQFLYLAVGTVTAPVAGTYTAGKFLIELLGYDA